MLRLAWWTPRRQLLGIGLTALLLLPLLMGRSSHAQRMYLAGNLQVSIAAAAAVSIALPTATVGSWPAAAGGRRPGVQPPAGDFTLVAPPSVSADLIDTVLAQYGSPAGGTGALFYDLGVKYGIDPAYALAFYIHESAAGTKGVARFTHGIGNIRWTAGFAEYEGYRSYPTYAAGIEDWYKLLKEQYVDGWGLRTPDTILLRYAPWGDNNNPLIYAATVKQLVATWQGH